MAIFRISNCQKAGARIRISRKISSHKTSPPTESENSRRLWLFPGSLRGSRGKLRESPGKIAGKFFPNREVLQILGFQAPGKANLPRTLGQHCLDLVPTFRAGCFLKSTVPAFSSFSDRNCGNSLILTSEWPASRHRIASVFASWECIAEDFRSENAHRQDFCIASHRHFRV